MHGTVGAGEARRVGSLAVGFAADWRAGAVPVIMLFALVVKEAHIPERWFRAGKFDYRYCVKYFKARAWFLDYMVKW